MVIHRFFHSFINFMPAIYHFKSYISPSTLMRIHLLRDFKRARTYKKYFPHITPISTIAKTRQIKFCELRICECKKKSRNLRYNIIFLFNFCQTTNQKNVACHDRCIAIENYEMKQSARL